MRSLLLLTLAWTAFSAPLFAEEPALSYNQDVKPILSDKCFACHGPDVPNNKANLRLDKAEDAYQAPKGSKKVPIVPGDAEKSEIYHRMLATDPEVVMPPPEAHLTMTPREIEVIKTWINQGAVYEDHWAFTPLPKTVPIPKAGEKWAQNPIDRFVAEKHAENGLEPSPEAPAHRWLRRTTFALTGLPPKPSDIAAFSQNPDRTAAVDRILATPAYGENMARDWLDAARYADSYGYQSDKLNTQWPYRDWVVAAFNRNLPYDEFLREQLAGDLLPKPTRDQKLATAFNRIHRLNNEGGAIFEEWRMENIADRVHTFGTAVLGLTMECARCHDHKYDPITQRDYFSLFSFFNSIDENGMYDRTAKVPSPSLLLPTETQEKAYQEAAAELKKQRATASNRGDSPEKAESPGPFVVDFSQSPTPTSQWYFSENDHNKAPDLSYASLNGKSALQLDGDRGVTVKDIVSFDRWTPLAVRIQLQLDQELAGSAVIAHHTRGTDAGYNGWELMLVDGHLEQRLYRVWPGNAMGVRSMRKLPIGKLVDLVATYDASDRAEGLRLYLDGELLETTVTRDEKQKSANVEVQHGGKFALGTRFRDRGLAHAQIQRLEIHVGGSDPHLRVLEKPNPTAFSPTPAYLQALQRFVQIEEDMQEVPVMKELPKPLPAYVLARGAYDAPKGPENRAYRTAFEHILPTFEGHRKDRLGLAEWALQPDHPLTARVFVNRLWQRFFGKGLVDTPENFGFQGSLPTHPALLDWLARDFIDYGWDVKRLCRQIVLSATYQQDSRLTAILRSRDPENLLLARGPAFRLSGEEIRDLVLTASDLLNPELGGPPVSPYQPGEDLWRESNGMSPPYRQDVGEALYRRSLYSVWKRTAPLPNMMAFDAPTREVCAVNRSRTNTPLQALVLLNDVQFVEAARQLAQKVAKEKATPESQIEAAFLNLTGRQPTKAEQKALQSLYSQELAHYQAQPTEATTLLNQGDSPPPENPTPHLAALTVTSQIILNLDATIWSR